MAVSPLLPVARCPLRLRSATPSCAWLRSEAILDVTVEHSLEGFICAVTIYLDDSALSERLSTIRLK
jgi:hypothetical protein